MYQCEICSKPHKGFEHLGLVYYRHNDILISEEKERYLRRIKEAYVRRSDL